MNGWIILVLEGLPLHLFEEHLKEIQLQSTKILLLPSKCEIIFSHLLLILDFSLLIPI
jgi:hypothetical protein